MVREDILYIVVNMFSLGVDNYGSTLNKADTLYIRKCSEEFPQSKTKGKTKIKTVNKF